MIGGTYLERGRPVNVLASWRGARMPRAEAVLISQAGRDPGSTHNFGDVVLQLVGNSGPRNVLIQREDGSLVVRPFRGLRRPKERA